MDTLDIHSVHMAEFNKSASNPRYSRHYDTSNHFSVCVNTGNTFDECEILNNHDFLKIIRIQFSLLKKRLNQLQTDRSTESISQITI